MVRIADHVMASEARQSGLRIEEGVTAGPPSLQVAVSSLRGQSVRNKPNLARLGQARVCDGERCGTNPISGAAGAGCAKRSQTRAGWDIWGTARRGGQVCETKPILRLRIADSGGPTACQLGPARAGCTNKTPTTKSGSTDPILMLAQKRRSKSGLRTFVVGVKQTQLPPPGGQAGPWLSRSRKTKTIWGARPESGDRLGETNPIRGSPPAPGGLSCETKPNLGALGYLGTGRGTQGRCPNKPNSRRGWTRDRASCEAYLQNKANLPARLQQLGWSRECRRWEQVVQNEAIFGRDRRDGSESATMGQPHGVGLVHRHLL
jgi:hypothetical protein